MMASPMMAELNKKLEDKGVTPLAYWDNGPTSIRRTCR